MRLEKIILDGFKSFADKTEFPFDLPITAIVGPNGCGKSNVVDAVKWVLGEQSVKSLRSGHMADVIFSGSSSRKALGAAQVTLLISNTKGQLPIEADQVEISRRIYRSGECEYRINSKLCRLRDIREMFMDTGVGAKAYSIIEQGQVEQLVSASKSDRRTIFEEAAGISKYKAHKKEATRKLDRTEQNLLRLADIITEVAKQLRSVKYQAGKARNYVQYNQRLKELQLNYSLAEYDKLINVTRSRQTDLADVEGKFAALVAELAASETLVTELGQKIIETENDINQSDNSLVAAKSKIEQHLQKIDFLKTRTAELEQRKASSSERIEEIQEQKKLFESELSRCTEQQAKCTQMHEEKSRLSEQLQRDIEQIDGNCASLEADLEDEKSGVIDIVRRTAQLHNEVRSISDYRSNLSSQKQRLSSRADTAHGELEQLLTQKAQHQNRMTDIEKVLGELKENLESRQGEIEQNEGTITADNKRLAHSKEVRSALNSEIAILTDMEERREGLKAGVKAILEKLSFGTDKFDYVEAVLADIITTDVKYANAVEAALEGKTDALVINNSDRLLADSETIEKLDSRVNFLCMDKIEPFVDKNDLSKQPCVKGRLIEFVNCESRYAQLLWKLLGKTIVVDSIDSAGQLAGKIGDSYNFVTLKGQFLTADGTIKLGPIGKTAGLISRKSRLHQLHETIGNINSEIEALERQIDKSSHTNDHLAGLCKDLRTAVYEANTEKINLSSKLTVLEQNIQRLKDEQPLIAGEIDTLETQIAESAQKEYNSKQNSTS